MKAATPHQFRDSSRFYPYIAWITLITATVFAYWPGLGGPFVLDDFGSLGALGNRGGVVDWASFVAFVFGGDAGPTGRPLALLSFLVDARDWPAESWPFKRTNLIVHIVCGILLYALTTNILRVLKVSRSRIFWVSLSLTGLWLLHPFLVSTTLYAVQRMAQLSTLFVFAGMLAYLKGRVLLAEKPARAYWIMSLSIGCFTLLAMVSKENGILLPSLIGVMEITIVASQSRVLGRLNRSWAILFLVVPSVVIVLYLGNRVLSPTFFDVVPPRDFSIYERLLTEMRILTDYLQNWFVPKLYTTGIFQDHFIKSTGLMQPISTLLNLLLHGTLAVVAIKKRRVWPLFAFAVLMFYVGHALESTVINLELYFEHRNYLAAAFLFLPLLVLAYEKSDPRVAVAGTVVVLALLASFTRYSASIWSDSSSMIVASAGKAPTSIRAQADLANNLFNAGQYEESLRVIDRAIAVIPGTQAHLIVNRLMMLCSLGILKSEDYQRSKDALSVLAYDPRLHDIYLEFAQAVAEGKCAAVKPDMLRDAFEEMLELPFNRDPSGIAFPLLSYNVGFLSLRAGDAVRAMGGFNASLDAAPSIDTAMNMAALMASHQHFEEALALSNRAMSQLLAEQGSLATELGVTTADIEHFQELVRRDLELQRDADSPRQDP